MALGMTSILNYDSTLYMIAVSLEMSDEPFSFLRRLSPVGAT